MESELLQRQDVARADCTEYLAEATKEAASMLPMDARTAFKQLLDETESMIDSPVRRQVVRDRAVDYIETLFVPGSPDTMLEQNVQDGVFEYFSATLAEKLLQRGPGQGAAMREFVDRVEQNVRKRLDTIQDEVQAEGESDE